MPQTQSENYMNIRKLTKLAADLGQSTIIRHIKKASEKLRHADNGLTAVADHVDALLAEIRTKEEEK